jgi:hypothetical protein
MGSLQIGTGGFDLSQGGSFGFGTPLVNFSSGGYTGMAVSSMLLA